MELVKNAYDACATSVIVSFIGQTEGVIEAIKVVDNGHGMTLAVITDAWLSVATPYRVLHTHACPKGRRRTSGEKGLGRLSSARLGTEIEVLTKAKGDSAREFRLNWKEMARAKSPEEWHADVSVADQETPIGTSVTITGLNRHWTKQAVEEIIKGLSRLLPPWSDTSDQFAITVKTPWSNEPKDLVANALYSDPVYRIWGEVDCKGHAKAKYTYRGKGGHKDRDLEFLTLEAESLFSCGSYTFEFRAWDLDKESILELQDRLGTIDTISAIRRMFAQSAYSGISLYRDNILVLPKSAKSQDWLELESRRVSRVGDRLSRAQVMGVVKIGFDQNPELRDTSDREGLINNTESEIFFESLKGITAHLERERVKDRPRTSVTGDKKAKNWLADLRDEEVVGEVREALVHAQPVEAAKAFERYVRQVQTVADEVEQRLVTYNRLAALGRLAGFLQHEVGNHTVSIEALISKLKKKIDDIPESLHKSVETAGTSVRSLKRLAQVFGPLASPRKRRQDCILEEVIAMCIETNKETIDRAKIQVKIPQTQTKVAIDTSELTSILYNLVENAVYWLMTVDGEKQLTIERRIKDGTAIVFVHDSGPGINEDDMESIFWPGVSTRPSGMGMGLTIASELVDAAKGQMSVASPGKLGGATFQFGVPLAQGKVGK